MPVDRTSLGYTKQLYVLPFDHRGSFQEGLFGWKGQLTDEQTARVTASKQVVYDGFKAALAAGVPQDRAGILVDEQFGAAILRDAKARGFVTAVMLFFVMMGLSVHDYQLNHFETKATVMEPTVPAYASPSADAPSLFEFREGDEVTIRRTQQDWLQVQKSATAVGWVKKNQILIHSGT